MPAADKTPPARKRGTTGDPYRRLAATLHALLEEQSAPAILDQVATEITQLIRCDDVVIWELRSNRVLFPAIVEGDDADEIRQLRVRLGEGITGSAVKQRTRIVSNDAHLDGRAGHVPGTTVAAEAILCIPLLARDTRLGALSIYRRGKQRSFKKEEVELAQQFADLAAIAIHNAQTLAKLNKLARTDELTGLPNRRHLQQELRRHSALAKRHGTPLSLLLLDLDNFKWINDTHGHDQGDRVLRRVASVLRSALRASDLAARTGGDEFTIILPDTQESAARILAAQLTDTLESAITEPVPLTVSIGVSAFRGDRHSLIRDADQQLYARKRQRRRSRGRAAQASRLRRAPI